MDGTSRTDLFAAVRFVVGVLRQCAVISSPNWDFLTMQRFTENTIIELEGDLRVGIGVCDLVDFAERRGWTEFSDWTEGRNVGGDHEDSSVLPGSD